jgi:2-dehydropantoate 2-reductase
MPLCLNAGHSRCAHLSAAGREGQTVLELLEGQTYRVHRPTHAFARLTASNRSSVLQDILRSSRTEIELTNVAILREAEKLGLRVPYNRALLELVRALEATRLACVA